MLNKELYEELRKEFGEKELLTFSLIVSYMFKTLFEDDVLRGNVPSEYEYDAMWWGNTHKLLKGSEKD